MKTLFLILLTTCSILSCTKDESFDNEQYPQKWTLTKMTGSFINSESTREDMEWQEYYILKSDGTFIKHRERDGIYSDASGTYSIINIDNEKFVDLIHEIESEIIANCYANQTESLWIKSEKKLIGTWNACDGPGLEYKRVE